MAEENISLIAKLFVGDEADQQLCLNVVGMILVGAAVVRD